MEIQRCCRRGFLRHWDCVAQHESAANISLASKTRIMPWVEDGRGVRCRPDRLPMAGRGRESCCSMRRQAEHNLDVCLREAAAATKGGRKIRHRASADVAVATNGHRLARQVPHRVRRHAARRPHPGAAEQALRPARALALCTPPERLVFSEETSPELTTLIPCDAEVQNASYLQPGKGFGRIAVHERGQTRFQLAFDWIATSGS